MLEREYKTERGFRKALARAQALGSLIAWWATDHGWIIQSRRMMYYSDFKRSLAGRAR